MLMLQPREEYHPILNGAAQVRVPTHGLSILDYVSFAVYQRRSMRAVWLHLSDGICRGMSFRGMTKNSLSREQN